MVAHDDSAGLPKQGEKPSSADQSSLREPDWKVEYEQLTKFLPRTGTVAPGGGPQKAGGMGQERRAEPRYAFKEGAQVFAHLGPKAFQIINIAIGGVAFYSDIYFESGTKLLLSALGMIALDVEILSCDMEEVDEGLMEYRYCVRAKFGPRVNGYQVYVLAREMYLQQTGEGDAPAFKAAAPEE
jgi:hypothetical protein